MYEMAACAYAIYAFVVSLLLPHEVVSFIDFVLRLRNVVKGKVQQAIMNHLLV